MKGKEIRELSKEEIEQRERECMQEHFDLRMKRASGKLDNPLKLRALRRDMARIKTILRERELSTGKAQDG